MNPPIPDHTLSSEAIRTAAQELATRRLTGRLGGALPEPCRPTTLSDALAVQEAVSAQLAQRAGARVVGWKCGLPGVDTWVLAPLYAGTLYGSGVAAVASAQEGASPAPDGCPVWTQHGGVQVEPELAFVLGRDLPARARPYAAEEVRAAIARAHLALELIDNRYDAQASLLFADRLADGLVNQGLWLGPAIDLALAYAAHTVDIVVRADAQPLLSQHGAHPAGDPLRPLCWLAEFLRGRGQGLQAGQVVITGSYAGAPWVPVGPTLQVCFGHLGMGTLRFRGRPRG